MPGLIMVRPLWSKVNPIFQIVCLLVLVVAYIQGENFTLVTRDDTLVVRGRTSSSSEDPTDAVFDLQDELDEATQDGISRLAFEVEKYVFQSALQVRHSLTITSNRSTKTQLSCREGTSLINITRDSDETVVVFFENLRITNCAATRSKGVIHVGSRTTVSFNNVEISNNVAEGDETAVLTADSGSEINILQDSLFSNNAGRVILVEGKSKVLIEGSSFVNNTAGINGSVLATKSGQGMIALTIRGNSMFESNRVNNGNGGVFWLENSNLTVEKGVRFTNNAAQHSGGAIYMLGITGMHVSDTVFDHNACLLGRGGALYISPEQSESTVTIERSVFSRNRATGILGIGGAVFYGLTDLEQNRRLYLSPDVLFWRNLARLSAGAVIVSNTKVNTNISSMFVGNMAFGEGGGIYIQAPKTYTKVMVVVNADVTGASFVNNTALYRGGGGISVFGRVRAIISTCNFSRNAAHQGAGVYSHAVQNISITAETVFVSNTAYKIGGSISVNIGRVMAVEHCVFDNNTALETGGGINVINKETVKIFNSTFRRNNASIGGGAINVEDLDTERGQGARIEMTSLTFEENQSPLDSNRDEDKGYGGAVWLLGGGVRSNITSCIFKNNSGNQGGAMSVSKAYSIIVENTTYSDNKADFGGAVYIVPLEKKLEEVQDSSNFTNCTFSGNEAQKGGAIYARSDCVNNENIASPSQSHFSIKDTNISKNKALYAGGGLHLSGMTVDLNSTEFSGNKVKASNGSTFELFRNQNKGSGGAIHCSYGSIIDSRKTRFIRNEAKEKGGALSIDNAFFDCSGNCIFQKNTADKGGAVFGVISSELLSRNRTASFHCDACTFQDNNAQLGGGIYYAIPQNKTIIDATRNCSVSHLGLQDNSRKSDEREECEDFVYLKNWNSSHNQANSSGHFIFTTNPFIVRVSENYSSENLVEYFHRKKKNGVIQNEFASIPCDFEAVKTPSSALNRGNTGEQMRDLQFSVYDCFTQLTNGTGTTIEIRACEGNGTCCPGGNVSEDTHFQFFSFTTVDVDDGRADFGGLNISDGDTGNTKHRLWACFEDHGEDPAVLDPIPVDVSFRWRYRLEKPNTGSRGGCSECESGQYYSESDQKCTPCSNYAVCGAITITPKKGHLHTSSTSGKIYECHPKKACSTDRSSLQENAFIAHQANRILLYNDTNYNQCQTGYEGLRCGTCTSSHGRWNSECVECMDAWVDWCTLSLVVLWNLFVLLVFIYSARSMVARVYFNQQIRGQRGVVQPQSHLPVNSNGIQLTAQVLEACTSSQATEMAHNSLLIDPPSSIGGTRFGTTRSVLQWRRFYELGTSDQLPLADPLSEAFKVCSFRKKIVVNFAQVVYLAALVGEDLPTIFRWSVIPLDGLSFAESAFLVAECLLKGHDNRTIIRMTLQVLFPAILILFLCMIPSILLMCGINKKFGWREVRLITLCTVYLFFGPEVRTLLKFLSSETVDAEDGNLEGVPFWASDSSVEFMTGSHALVVGLLVLPLLAILTIGFPSVLFFSLRKQKHNMQEEDVVSSYGFLYKGYEPRYYYWETIIIIRKIILAVISVFVRDPELQAAFFCIALVFFLSLQLILQPFTSSFPRLNELEALSLGMSALIFSGVNIMLRSDTVEKNTLREVTAWLLLLVLVVTTVIMVVELCVATQDFLNDKLVEYQIHPDRKTAKTISVSRKICELAKFYFRRLYSKVCTRRIP